MKLHRRETDFPVLYENVLGMVRRTLREDWDPLGVTDLPSAYDEYDSYAPGLATMLMHGAEERKWKGRQQQLLETLGLTEAGDKARATEIFDLLRERARGLAEGYYD